VRTGRLADVDLVADTEGSGQGNESERDGAHGLLLC
jgi:hypothetical protein